MRSKLGAGIIAGLVAGVVFGMMMQMMNAPTPDGYILSLTFARTASSIPLAPFQQRTFVVLCNYCSLESFSRWTINLASCRHTAGFVL